MRDRDLVRLYWPVELRPAFDALFDIDEAMGDVVARVTEPALAAIKLAWWRERLQELDDGKVPAEPRLQSAAAELLPHGITGAMLAELENCWALLLMSDQHGIFARGVATRGLNLFTLAARLLGISMDESLESGASSFAAADLGRRGVIDLMQPEFSHPKIRVRKRARPLTMLVSLARRDLRHGGPPFEPEATPGRALALLRHRLTGRLH